MGNLSFKTFVWVQNPHTYQEKASRDAQGQLVRIITAKGRFYGADAYTRFKSLQKLMEEAAAGDLEHPVWGIRHCRMTGLDMIQEPAENVVVYEIEFTQVSGVE